jgi:hypothetical protein
MQLLLTKVAIAKKLYSVHESARLNPGCWSSGVQSLHAHLK